MADMSHTKEHLWSFVLHPALRIAQEAAAAETRPVRTPDIKAGEPLLLRVSDKKVS